MIRLLETTIAAVSPGWAAKRSADRLRYYALNNYTGQGGGYAYQAADPRARTPVRWLAANGTADNLLIPSLPVLIARSRDALRNHPAYQGAIAGRTANVVGTGIGVEADSGDDSLDELLTDGFESWAESASVDGRSLWELQDIAYRERLVVGGFLWRWVVDGERAARGLIPDCLLELDVEWLSQVPLEPIPKDCRFAGGITFDKFKRPKRYHLRNPDIIQGVPGEVVDADQIIHGYKVTRPGQTRGEPEGSASLLWLWNGHSLIEAELRAAVTGAAPSVVVKASDGGASMGIGTGANAASPGVSTGGSASAIPALGPTLPSGAVAGLFPGESIEVVENKRPSQQIFPFLKSMWGVVAGAFGIGRRWIDRDASDASYSSQRADQQDTRRQLEPDQYHFGRHVALLVYRRIAPLVAAAAGRPLPANPVRRERLLRAHIQPDGWPYVNPLEDIQAQILAVASGFSTYNDEVTKRGGSLRRMWRQAAKDRDLATKMDLHFDLSGKTAPTTLADASQNTQPKPQAA